MHAGMLYAATAYALWGLFPVYFKVLKDITPIEILIHRIIWSLVFLMIVLAWRRQWSWISSVLRQPRVLAGFVASALILSCNWLVYIWAVNNGRVVEASLGYFINPLVTVLLGLVLLHERLRPGQWAAVAFAAAGVAWLTWQGGHLPWLSLSLAISFGAYGLLRKTAALGALEGLALETLILFPAATGYLIFLMSSGQSGFVTAPASSKWLLAMAGPMTAIPLLMFATAARRIPLSMLGLFQYISPTLQLLIGIWLYHEPFGGTRLIGFVMIWISLALYSAEGLWCAWSSRTGPA